MGHWYSLDGKPQHFIIGANGQSRDSTLRDARKHGWVPSVTEVLNVIDKPALTNWKVDQGIMAALTLPRLPDEPEGAYLSRIKTDSAAQAKEAAEEGSRIHKAIESHFLGEPYGDVYRPHVDGVLRKLAELFPSVTDWRAEMTFASPLGFGGCMDLHSPSTGIVVDFKGKDGDFTDGKKLAYDQDRQLAAYQKGANLPENVAANIFVSRTHPGAVKEHLWTVEELSSAWQVFTAALALWKAIKKVD